MITKRTVFVLGAGASAHYGFPTGGDLLLAAQELTERQLEEHIPSSMQSGISTLYDTLAHTGESSIDAMLETRGDIQVPGKALIARLLLQSEWNVKPKYGPKSNWYRTLFGAMNAPTLSEVLSQPVTFVTFNYDRSLEHFLAEALRVKFTPDQTIDPAGLRRMFIHVHGQLGCLPQIGGDSPVVSYGGSAVAITEQHVLIASKAIRIISDPHPNDPQFAAAREALKAAERINILGFGFAARNVVKARPQKLHDSRGRGVRLYTWLFRQSALVVHSSRRKKGRPGRCCGR